MKKLFIMLSLFAAVTSYGSSIIWTVSTTVLDNNNVAMADGYMAYLVYAGADNVISASWNGSAWSMGDDAIAASSVYYFGMPTGGTAGVSTSIGSQYYLLFVTSAAGGPPAGALGDFYGVTALKGQTKDGAIDSEMMTWSGSYKTTTELVPEPTSFALLGLGAAALALRRRLRK